MTAKTRRTSANGRAQDSKKTVLFICHNHPSVRPEEPRRTRSSCTVTFATSGEFESVFLAKGGPPLSVAGRQHLGTCVAPVNGCRGRVFRVHGWTTTSTGCSGRPRQGALHEASAGFLDAIRPDVVHFQHTLFLGYDLLREVRTTFPDAAILYTLHEFMPICHRQGQMVRTMNNQPCAEESPRRCHECFPDISPQTFFLRKRFIQSHFDWSICSSLPANSCSSGMWTGGSRASGSCSRTTAAAAAEAPR